MRLQSLMAVVITMVLCGSCNKDIGLQLGRLTVLTDNVTRACSVGPCATLGQMLVKSELPLDSALVNDSDIKTLGWICFLTPKVGKFIKSKMAATEFMKCTLCHIFATR